MNASGEALDRWIGFTGAERWQKTFDAALADPTSIESKKQRFASQPTAELAAALGRIHGSLRERKESVASFQQAMKLAEAPRSDYASAVFFQQMMGLAADEFTVADLKASADAVMAAPGDPADKLFVAAALSDVASDRNDPSLIQPYAAPALEASAGLTDARSKKLRTEIEVADALLVKKDQVLAVQLMKASMPPGWEQNAGELNDFAGWCFQHKVDMPEAQTLARKAVDLAEPGAEKAQVLDTLAELCNELGNCSDALDLSRRAAKEDPSDEHYTKQVQRFSELNGKKKAATGA